MLHRLRDFLYLLGTRLANWNDGRIRYDKPIRKGVRRQPTGLCKKVVPRTWHVFDRIASWLHYVGY